MRNEIRIKQVFDCQVEELFTWFIEAKKIEQWSAPDGMTLKVPLFEARNGGDYRYEHTAKDGKYTSIGHVREIVPNVRMRMMDDKILGPEGGVLMRHLTCEIYFHKKDNGTEVEVVQAGFPDEKFAQECETSWKQCFGKLEKILNENRQKAAA